MVHLTSEDTPASVSQASLPPDAAPAKGDPYIMHCLRVALGYKRKLPAFARGQIHYDFDLGKVMIGA